MTGMKKYLIAAIALLVMVGCNRKDGRTKENVLEQDTVEVEDTIAEDSVGGGRGLNAIRFENFDDEDWIDNDYIRALRGYFDDFSEGKIENEDLEPYRDLVKGKFAIYFSEPAMMGGLFLRVTFVDAPNIIFSSWVYSGVDEEREVVVDYQVRGVHIETESNDMTKEELLQLLKEHPEHKLW